MDTFVAVVHIITALLLITLVLLQDSKGGGALGASFGGGSNSVFGATGATTLAQKLTRIAAGVFAITSITLAVTTKGNRSVVEGLPVAPPAATAEALPGSAPVGATPEAAASAATTTTLPTK